MKHFTVLFLFSFIRWVSDVPASADGRNRWDEAGADQSHPQLHCYQTQPLWERHKGESPVRYCFCFPLSTINRTRLDSSMNEQAVSGIMTSSSMGLGGID